MGYLICNDLRMRLKIAYILLICVCSLTACSKIKQNTLDLDGSLMPFSVAAGTDSIYFVNMRYDEDGYPQESSLYEIKNGSDTPKICEELQAPVNMVFYKVAADVQGNLSILLCNGGKPNNDYRYEIWKISQEGNVTEKYDITRFINQQMNEGIYTFSLDGDGRYYIREKIANETIVLDAKGGELYRIEDIEQGISFESMCRDKEGRICALFCNSLENNGGYKIIIYSSMGEAQEYYDGDLLPYWDIYSVMGTGIKSDLLIKGASGVYSYSFGDDRAEKLIELTFGQKVATRSCFMNDDRLFMITMSAETDAIEGFKNVQMHYFTLW